MGHKLNSKK